MKNAGHKRPAALGVCSQAERHLQNGPLCVVNTTPSTCFLTIACTSQFLVVQHQFMDLESHDLVHLNVTEGNMACI